MTFIEIIKKAARVVRASVSALHSGSIGDRLNRGRKAKNPDLGIAAKSEDDSSEWRSPTPEEHESLRKRAHQVMDKYPTAFKRLAE